MLADTDVTKTVAYQSGLIEIQDLGSQLILETIGIDPGSRWLDACAGAGGKTLQLAALTGPRGHVEAHDIRADALRMEGLQQMSETFKAKGSALYLPEAADAKGDAD